MRQILSDSSFLYSLFSEDDKNQRKSQRLLGKGDLRVIIPEITLAEVTFLFFRSNGVPAVAQFLRVFAKADNQPVSLLLSDYARAGAIMTEYRDSRLDFVDCAIMALSERLNITAVATYDRRDFSIFRPKHCDYLELLP